jgi:hypothetical protein
VKLNGKVIFELDFEVRKAEGHFGRWKQENKKA